MIFKNDDHTYHNHFKLKQNIAIPSLAHSYGMAIEYMRYWFLKQFDKNFFKSVYIDGKYIFDDFREFNKIPLKKEKPMLAIMPTINTEYDRDKVDLFQGGRELLTRRTSFHNTGFMQDFEKNQFLGLRMRQIEMNFTFKIRVTTRSQQLDLLEYMKMAFRVGSSQSIYMNMDIHVPYEIMLNIVEDVGFTICDGSDGRKRIVDVCQFLRYLNSHSHIPFLYRFRAANGNSEFFIRMKDAFVRVWNLENISIHHGEQIGMNNENYHLEMNTMLHFPAPALYYYYTNKTLNDQYIERNSLARLYTFDLVNVEPPNVDEHGWRQYLTTEYYFDSLDEKEIEFKELLENKNLMRVIEYTVNSGLSPSIFMNVLMYNSYKKSFIKIDWENYKILIVSPLEVMESIITIYVDLEYVNNIILMLDTTDRVKEN